MSRSYKHTPIIKDKHSLTTKTMANRRLRRVAKTMETADGEPIAINGHVVKKINDSWDICDYVIGPELDVQQQIQQALAEGDKKRARELRKWYVNK